MQTDEELVDAAHTVNELLQSKSRGEIVARLHTRALKVLCTIRKCLELRRRRARRSRKSLPYAATRQLLVAGARLYANANGTSEDAQLVRTTSHTIVEVIYCDGHVATPRAETPLLDEWFEDGWVVHLRPPRLSDVLVEPCPANCSDTDAAKAHRVAMRAEAHAHVHSRSMTLAPSVCTLVAGELGRLALDNVVPQARVDTLADTFYMCMRQGVLVGLLPVDRSVMPPVDGDTGERLRAIVDAASSELGQNAVKDLMLSFLLPRRVIGHRQSLLLDREMAHQATKYHSTMVGRAHATAMVRSSVLWERCTEILAEEERATNSTATAGMAGTSSRPTSPSGLEEIEPTDDEPNDDEPNDDEANATNNGHYVLDASCALLAGLAMLLSTGASDARRGIAYQGRVDLPFLRVPAPNGARLAFVWGEWVCYEANTSTTSFVVYTRGPGITGLKNGVVALLALLAL
jgi:hypothetical protein